MTRELFKWDNMTIHLCLLQFSVEVLVGKLFILAKCCFSKSICYSEREVNIVFAYYIIFITYLIH